MRAGHAVSIITGIDTPESLDLPEGVAVQRVLPSIMKPKRFNSPRLLAAGSTVRRLTAHADVVHVLAEPYALACGGVDRPLWITAHGTYLPLTLARRPWAGLYRRVYDRARIVCVSRYTEEQVRAVYPAGQTLVIPNGVDIQAVRRSVAPIAKRGLTVISVGQLKPRKGFHILARAMKHVREKIPDAHAIFIGDDSDSGYVDGIRAQLAVDGLTDVVRIAGRVSDEIKIGWLQAAEVFALPALNTGGKFEGFGLVYLEASAAGLPVIGTLGCGAEDAIIDGETGYLIDQDDEQATADRIIRLLGDGALRQRMGAAGWEFAESHTWERMTARILQAYRGEL